MIGEGAQNMIPLSREELARIFLGGIPPMGGGATEVKTDATGVFWISATVDPGNHTAVTAVDTTVSHSDIRANDLVVAVPPATLEAGIAVQTCHTIAAGSFKLRTTNASAGAIDPASATWKFLVLRF